MTAVATPAGAVSHETLNWHALDWRNVHRIVRRLQARIVKAVQEGRWGKVNALQHVLTHSLSGKALAVKRVTENPGKQTPGVDGDIWDSPTKKMAAIGRLRQRGYHPLPLRRVRIPKPHSSKLRPLSIPSLRDRPCRPSIGWHWTPLQKPPRIGTPMGFGPHAVRRMRWNSAGLS
jgi:RNA-directed DNA polymerase